LRFSELGTRTITVYDFDNESGEISTNIKGEKTVEVVSEDPGGESGTTSELQIVKPQNNSMQGGSTIVVVGKGFANSNLKLFLDDEFASLIEVDTDGLFTTEITSVSDGEHTLFVQEAEGAMRSSEIVTFRVDSNSPELEDLELFPESGVKAGESFTATVFSEGDLDRVGFRAAGISENLPEDTFESGRYELTMTAPQDPGEYPISIELVDELQNKSEISAAGILKVLPAGNLDLPAATNFQAEAKDRSVLLTWNFDEIGSDVAGFQILAGRSASSLSRVSEVAVSTREFTVSGLENDQEYYFALTSLDGVENEGSQTPVITARPEGNGNPTTPPIVKDPSEHGSSLVFEATAGSRRVYLRWDGHGEAESYAVKISVNGVNFAENIILPSSARTAEITDLINGQKYYFELIPLDASGNSLGDSYPTVSITPTWDGTHPTAAPLFIENYRPDTNSEQGPATWGLLILGTMLIGGYLFKRYFVYFRGY
jgi:hypothetical protein